MYKILLSATCAFVLTACVSAEEQAAAKYRFQSIAQNQCEDMGFPVGTTRSMQCQMFYEDIFQYEIDDYWYQSKVDKLEKKMYQMRNECQNYWGYDSDISPSALWVCIQQKGNSMKEQERRERELKEQERALRNAISEGQKDAYEEARVQARIDQERDRVARETGKNPKKIRCTSSKKSNGYIKVKCK